jgi:integrase
VSFVARDRRSDQSATALPAAGRQRTGVQQPIRAPTRGFRRSLQLAGYVATAAKVSPTLQKKHVTPHCFRHAAAVSLVSSGVDVTVIRSWLGHASLESST